MAEHLLGAHVSVAGGISRAPGRGARIGATAIQVFTKSPTQWRERSVTTAAAQSFAFERRRCGIRAVVAHDCYLINLASPDPALRARSVAAFSAELARCAQLRIPYLVSHPGNFIDDRATGLSRNASAVAKCLARTPATVTVLFEATAGSGTALGSTFEELAQLRDAIPPPLRRRVAFCADTCHLYAAGYDLVADYDAVWREWDRVLGLRRLRCLHLNDSVGRLRSRRDRHALIAEGLLGAEPFRRLMRDRRFHHVIKVIETPKGDDPVRTDRRMLTRLRRYGRNTGRARGV